MSDLLVFEDLNHFPTNTHIEALKYNNSLIHVVGTDTKMFENNVLRNNASDNSSNNKEPKPNKLSKKTNSNDSLLDFFLTKF